MKIVDPHIHCVCRTTDDYVRLAQSNVVAVTEPAFWPGFDRMHAETFRDYFRQLADFEHTRAARYGIDHYCWVGMNAKEAENISLAREVIEVMREFLSHPRVLGIGEVGLNKNTANEIAVFEEQVALAAEHDQLLLIHTPHLEDKREGTQIIIDILKNEPRISPQRVGIDHVEEHTIEQVLAEGFWCGLTLYPLTKCTAARAADIIERYGGDMIYVDSSADWGPSDALAVVNFVLELRRRGRDEQFIERIVYDNPCRFLSQCGNWPHRPR